MRPWSLAWGQPGRRRLLSLFGLTITLITAGAMAAVPRSAAISRPVMQAAPWDLPASMRSRQPEPIRLLVLGDSVASGAGCACVPFATLLAQKLASATGHVVPVSNAAQDGLTTRGLLDQLQRPDVDRSLAQATLVAVTIGANDFDPDLANRPDCLGTALRACVGARLTSFGAVLTQALDQIRTLAPRTQILVAGYWNIFLDGEVGRQQGETYVHISDALTRTVNAVIAERARGTGATYVDLYTPFERQPFAALTTLLSPDGDHPSATGHQLISDVLLRAISSPSRTR